jgi:hypothetical protein
LVQHCLLRPQPPQRQRRLRRKPDNPGDVEVKEAPPVP